MQLVDGRALLGAIALNITGVILGFLVYQYMNSTSGMQVFTRSRLVWEIILNLQILSFALMWVCYSDRIEMSTGSKRTLQRVRRWFSLVTVLLPVWLGLWGIQQNWFQDRPSDSSLITIAVFVFSYWIVGVFINMLVARRMQLSEVDRSAKKTLLLLSPIISLFLIAGGSIVLGASFWLCLIPILIYLQGSVPYLDKAFALK